MGFSWEFSMRVGEKLGFEIYDELWREEERQ